MKMGNQSDINEELMKLAGLRKDGIITDEEFTSLKADLIARHSNVTAAGQTASQSSSIQSGAKVLEDHKEKASRTSAQVSNTVTKNSDSDTASGFRSTALVLYWAALLLGIVGAIPGLFWVSIVVDIGIIIFAIMKMTESKGTIYESHFLNVVIIEIVSTGLVIIITLTPSDSEGMIVFDFILIAVVSVWWLYRFIKGLMRLSRGEPYPNPKGFL